MPSEDAVGLRDVTFAYKAASPVLDIEQLRIPQGQSVFLHGPSGSGKTTLLSLLSGVLTPQTGSIRILDQELTKLSATARDTFRGSRIGYIFQGFNLIPYLSVVENIALPCQLHPSRLARIASPNLRDEVSRLAQRLDILPILNAPVTHLSTGQQQRVAIARAIIGSPSLLIADEPTSSLDTDRRDHFLTLLREMLTDTQTTLLFVSHDRSLAHHFDTSLSLATLNRTAQP